MDDHTVREYAAAQEALAESCARLRESEQRLRLALESGGLGSWDLDLRTRCYGDVSEMWRRHFGRPDAILRNLGRLSKAEFPAIKQHPTIRATMVAAVRGLEETLDAVRHHHER